MEWLRTGIEQGRIPYNQKNARVHVVPEGVLLVTPTATGENIHQYTLGVGSSQTVLSGFLLKDSSLVFGEFVPKESKSESVILKKDRYKRIKG